MQNRIHLRPGGSRAQHCGFTLIEMLVGLAVIAILAAVAIPSFMDSIRKGRRSEAFAAMAAVQQAQERWRTTHAQYADGIDDLGITSPTPSGYYQLATSPAAGASAPIGYTVTAVGVGGSQANDAQCRKLSVQVDRGTIKYAGCGNCATFTYNAQDPCWKQ